MSELKKYNNFSDKLRSFLPKLEPGQKIRFQLNSVHVDKVTKKIVCPNSFNLPQIDRIWDPWAKKIVGSKNEQYEGAWVDIAYVEREIPGKQDSMRDSQVVFGRVEFSRTFFGIIEIMAGKRDQEKMLPLLFFSNRNSANIDKPWYVKSSGKMIFHQIEKDKESISTLKQELKGDQAREIISNFSEEEVNEAAAGLMPGRHSSMSYEEKVLGLRTFAKTNPDKIINLSKDVEVKSTALIEEFLKNHLIDFNAARTEIIWSDDKTKICTIKPGQTPHMSLKRYFMTEEGMEVLLALEKQLAATKMSKKEKTEKPVLV